MRTVLNKKTVGVNEFKRQVGLVVQDGLMYGYINKTKFVWKYTTELYPMFEAKQSDPEKSAKYGRLYILERLKLDNVNLNIKTIEKTVPYVSLSKKDGVWINCFSNGYLRGQVNGISFVWHPGKYKKATAVNQVKGSSVAIDTNLIIKRIRQAGCNTMAELMEAVEKHTGVKYTGPVSISKPANHSSKPVHQPVTPIEDPEQTTDLDPIEVDMISGDFSRPSEDDIRRLSMVYEEPAQEEELEGTPILIASGDKFEVGLTPDGKFVGTNNGKPFCQSALGKLPKRVKESICALGYVNSKAVKDAFFGNSALRVSYSPIVDDCSSVLQACLCFSGRPLVSDDIA